MEGLPAHSLPSCSRARDEPAWLPVACHALEGRHPQAPSSWDKLLPLAAGRMSGRCHDVRAASAQQRMPGAAPPSRAELMALRLHTKAALRAGDPVATLMGAGWQADAEGLPEGARERDALQGRP